MVYPKPLEEVEARGSGIQGQARVLGAAWAISDLVFPKDTATSLPENSCMVDTSLIITKGSRILVSDSRTVLAAEEVV